MADRFLSSITPESYADGQVVLSVPSSFNSEWIKNRCFDELRLAISEQLNESVTVTLKVTPQARSGSANGQAAVRLSAAIADRKRSFQPVPKFRFETFITGESNELAYRGALEVARDPGKRFNPLFIYGPSGHGKTHLLHAIAHAIQANDPSTNVAYLSAAQFTEEFVSALREGKIEQFRRMHRSVNVWLVDDIQFVAGKDRTQEEIFYTFNTLQQAGKQVVFCSDRPPRDFCLTHERLRSRFESGLLADIQPPDTQTRVRILQSKAQHEDVDLSDEVALYLASHVYGNVRTLEGALNHVLAKASLLQTAPTLDMVQAIVERHFSEPIPTRPNQVQILEAVSRYSGIPADQIKGTSRKAPIAMARHIAVFMTRETTGDSWKHIGAQFGDRDHTSMMHAYTKISEMIARDAEFAATIRSLMKPFTRHS